jgi:hypothetical protein
MEAGRDTHDGHVRRLSVVRARSFWVAVYRVLFAGFLGTAALNMLHVRAGFLTNHAADLIVPAWLYVVFRGLHRPPGHANVYHRTLGRTPELAAASLFVASTLTELSQVYWPRGMFAGRFDPLDILAYGCGLAVCYVVDKVSRERPPDIARALR